MKKTAYNYIQLQDRIDTLIGKFGLQKTIEVIEHISNNTALQNKDTQKMKLLILYTISQSIDIFNIEEENYFTSTIEEYKEARMSCYYLLKKYSDISHASIGENFQQSKRAILYHHHKCEEILSIPQFYKSFVEKFKTLENNVINFITKLE